MTELTFDTLYTECIFNKNRYKDTKYFIVVRGTTKTKHKTKSNVGTICKLGRFH